MVSWHPFSAIQESVSFVKLRLNLILKLGGDIVQKDVFMERKKRFYIENVRKKKLSDITIKG